MEACGDDGSCPYSDLERSAPGENSERSGLTGCLLQVASKEYQCQFTGLPPSQLFSKISQSSRTERVLSMGIAFCLSSLCVSLVHASVQPRSF